MPLWYNPPKDGARFANLAVSDWATVNSRIDFKEIGIIQNDEFYFLFGHANEATDAKYVDGAKDWKFEPQLVTIKIAKRDYLKYSSKEKKQVPAQQTGIEKFFCECFKTLELDKIYSGKLHLVNNPQIDMFNNGALDENMMTMTIKMMVPFSVVEAPELINLTELEMPTSSSGKGGYSKGQTEIEKLNERTLYLRSQLALMLPDMEFNNLGDVYTRLADEKTTVQVQQAIDVVKLVLGNG